MKVTTHNLGLPRIGPNRELKKALEAYWRGDMDGASLDQTCAQLKQHNWRLQLAAGMQLIPVNDFSCYDHVLDMSCLLGVVPARFNWQGAQVDRDTYFAMARGTRRDDQPVAACEMTKWFDTNYHYLVPELERQQTFCLAFDKLFDEVAEAQALGINAKPVIIGPLSWLWLAKTVGEDFDKLSLLPALLDAYAQILERLQRQGVQWLQMDEPILVLDLPPAWQNAFEAVYHRLNVRGLNIMLASYFGALQDNLGIACNLPVAGLHVDLVRGAEQLHGVIDRLPSYKVLSLGIVDGRNIWRSDLDEKLSILRDAARRFPGELWLAPSCSLLHVPVDLEQETELDAEIKSWLAFGRQKLQELYILQQLLQGNEQPVAVALAESRQAQQSRLASSRIHRTEVQQRVQAISDHMLQRRRPYRERSVLQKQWLQLPAFPTTTIGSFPQTAEIRTLRRDYKQQHISHEQYLAQMQQEIARVVAKQEALGLDVLVHGEAERNDMVEYFGEQLDGFAFTRNGWVQSYGSRCVKPPIIYGDVSRPRPMTVFWAQYAQSLTDKPMKGMLTGPVTILNWSFVRDDQPRATTAQQIALALRDEVEDLEAAGIRIIQIDEAALREGLPLRKRYWRDYLQWTVDAFRLSAGVAADSTQIHTHMCYADFNDIMQAIAEMDADVITIETSRSHMALLDAFEDFAYPNEIGPGVYDIHSPNVPSREQIVALMQKAAQRMSACGSIRTVA